MDWNTCGRCNGGGQVEARIAGLVTCPVCAGHGVTPAGEGTASFYKPRTEYQGPRIALLTTEPGGGYRVTTYAADSGPLGHYCEPAGRIMRELRGYRKADTAARLLDYWATRPEWKAAMDRIAFLTHWNRLYRAGRYDLCGEMDQALADRGMAEALKVAERFQDERQL